jgi:ABC-2 type transport system permease protein
MRAAVGTVIYFGLIGLLSFGVAMAVRDTAAALTVVLTLLLAFPILAQLVTEPHWRELLVQLSPMSAGLSVQMTRCLESVRIGPWQGLGVLAAYSVAAALAGAVLFRFRDA